MSEVTHGVSSGAHRVDKHASSNQDPHAEFHVPMSTYVIVFVLLMVGLIVTVIAAFIDLGEANMIVAMLIAGAKAALVILYFMHVKYASRLTKIFVSAAFLWLALLFALTFTDYVSRNWLPNSRGWEDNLVKTAYDRGHAEHQAKKEGKANAEAPAAAAAEHGEKHDASKSQGRPGAG